MRACLCAVLIALGACSHFSHTLLALSAVIAVAAAPQTPARVPLEVLLDRAAWYLESFVDEFENVVAEETYIQDSSVLLPSFSPVGGRGNVSPSPPSEMLRARHRDLRSDFLLVKSIETSALVPFRDVITVDGVAVRDREARLAKLFMNASTDAMAQAEHIREEGARYNLGNMRSTLGNPVLALGLLQRSYQSRFRFSLGKDDKTAATAGRAFQASRGRSAARIPSEAAKRESRDESLALRRSEGRPKDSPRPFPWAG
jgi:hypothetical protein